MRFFVRSQGLSLFATGEFKELLLQGFYKQVKMSIGYRKIACHNGITGSCARVNFVSVDSGGNF